MIWPFRPTTSITFESALPPAEVLARLRDSTPRFAFFRDAVVGTARSNRIVLSRLRALTGYNPLSPQFRGHIRETPNGGAEIAGAFRSSWLAVLWAYSLYPFLAFFLVAIVVVPDAQVRPSKAVLLAALAGITTVWSIALALLRYQARNDASFLSDHIEKALRSGV